MRSSGVLLHPTCLPGDGIGTLGSAAYRFVDWLRGAGQKFWQTLPLTIVDGGGCPYNGLSALAGNPLLIDLESLAEEGLLARSELVAVDSPPGRVDYASVMRWKEELLTSAHRAFAAGAAPQLTNDFAAYRDRNAEWLDDYTLFRALRRSYHGASWTQWESELRDRRPHALERARRALKEDIDQLGFQQFLFDRQWRALREYSHGQGVRIVGDIPIFVAHDSADVWANRELFTLDERGNPEVVSGVPPDYYSKTGQRWGNPLYRWDVMRGRHYHWWVERFRRAFHWVDVARIDHFRGFEAYWEIPASESTAVHGEWRLGPGLEFFRAVEAQLGRLPVIAEDLGLITREVETLRDELGFPGMRVLQFAFDGDTRNPHLPENYPVNSVAYTGTHDNDTVLGWWRHATADMRHAVHRLIGEEDEEIEWKLMDLVSGSRAELAVVPVQDVLGLGSEARMNTPGTSSSNWSWRLRGGELTQDLAGKLRELTQRNRRLAAQAAAPAPLSTGA